MAHSKKYFGLKPSKQFGDYLRELRESNTNLSQAEAARRVGLSPEQLNYVEQGTRAPRDLPLIKLAQLYKVSPDEVLRSAYWPQLVLLPLISIIEPEQLSKDLIEELEKGLAEEERREITQLIEELLHRRTMVTQH